MLGNKPKEERTSKNIEVATDIVYKKYRKTFIDLAKYDKGEKIFN